MQKFTAGAMALLLLGCDLTSGVDRATDDVGPPLDDDPGTAPLPRLAHPLYGVSVDSVTALPAIVESLAALARKPTVRIVFDAFAPPSDYADAIAGIKPVAFVMGEILDSAGMALYSLNDYVERTREYLDAFGANVDIWEIGNEVNGGWLGDPALVAAKVAWAYQLVEQRGGRTALTVYYNEGCTNSPQEAMFPWIDTYIPDAMRAGLDYVFVSYYEDDCNGLQPNWAAVFRRLAALFPASFVGFGEVGTAIAARKEEYITRYYTQTVVDEPSFVGGYFWWYYKQDMVPRTQYLWQVLNDAFALGPVAQ